MIRHVLASSLFVVGLCGGCFGTDEEERAASGPASLHTDATAYDVGAPVVVNFENVARGSFIALAQQTSTTIAGGGKSTLDESGSFTFSAPSPRGLWVARAYSTTTFEVFAESAAFVVSAAPLSLALAKSNFAAEEPIVVHFNGMSGTPGDAIVITDPLREDGAFEARTITSSDRGSATLTGVGIGRWVAQGFYAGEPTARASSVPFEVLPAGCMDGVVNAFETDADCGGPECTKCGDAKKCITNADCTSNACDGRLCLTNASCTDGLIGGLETDVDCGGPTCPKCAYGKSCQRSSDCATNECYQFVCSASPTLSAITPPAVPNDGGTVVTLTGTSFVQGATAQIGGIVVPASWSSATTMTAKVPPKLAYSGPVEVKVTNPDGQTTLVAGTLTYTGFGFGPVDAYQVPTSATNFDVGDLNGDANVDVVISGNPPAVWINQGGGKLAAGQPLTGFAQGPNTRIALASMSTGDSILDIVVTGGMPTGGPKHAELTVALGVGNGTFGVPKKTNFGSPQDVSSALVVGDFDADGKRDVAYWAYSFDPANPNGQCTPPSCLSTPAMYMAKGVGDGTFTLLDFEFSGSKGPRPLVGAQLNAGGVLDLVGGEQLDKYLSPVFTRSNVAIAAPQAIAADDVNGDGNTDLVVATVSGSTQLFLGNGDGTFQTPTTMFSGAPTAIAIGDLDGDGKKDLVIADFASTRVLRGTGPTTFAAPLTLLLGGAQHLLLKDLDGDGKLDVLGQDYSKLRIQLNRSP